MTVRKEPSLHQPAIGRNRYEILYNFDPAIKYYHEIDETGLTLRSDKFDIEKSYTVTLKRKAREDWRGIKRRIATPGGFW